MSKAIDRANKDSANWKIIFRGSKAYGDEWDVTNYHKTFVTHSEKDALWLQRVLETETAVK